MYIGVRYGFYLVWGCKLTFKPKKQDRTDHPWQVPHAAASRGLHLTMFSLSRPGSLRKKSKPKPKPTNMPLQHQSLLPVHPLHSVRTAKMAPALQLITSSPSPWRLAAKTPSSTRDPRRHQRASFAAWQSRGRDGTQVSQAVYEACASTVVDELGPNPCPLTSFRPSLARAFPESAQGPFGLSGFTSKIPPKRNAVTPQIGWMQQDAAARTLRARAAYSSRRMGWKCVTEERVPELALFQVSTFLYLDCSIISPGVVGRSIYGANAQIQFSVIISVVRTTRL